MIAKKGGLYNISVDGWWRSTDEYADNMIDIGLDGWWLEDQDAEDAAGEGVITVGNIKSIFDLKKDDILSMFTIIDSDHYEVHEGEMFQAFKYISALADGASANISITTGAKYAHMKTVRMWSSNAEVWMRLYETPSTATGGAAISAVVKNRAVSNSSTITMKYSGTVTIGSGVLVDYRIAGGGGSNQASRSGNESSFPDEMVLETGTVYVVNIVNKSGGAANILTHWQWYEESTNG